MSEPQDVRFRAVQVRRVGRAPEGAASDHAAVEEPLEIRLHGEPFAVIMRTPGDDKALAAGFLLAEGIVRSAADLGAVEHCRHPDYPDAHNVVDVYLIGDAAGARERTLDARRNVTTNSSCGVCGRLSIESLRQHAAPVAGRTAFDSRLLADLPSRLRARQRVFDGTGGLHGAALFSADGLCERAAEDVGRHNAVDKVIGSLLLDEQLPLAGRALAVSGRTSFEIVQKAWYAGIELICAVSAPSTLAIDLAREAGITLLGFARDGGFNVYTHGERVGG